MLLRAPLFFLFFFYAVFLIAAKSAQEQPLPLVAITAKEYFHFLKDLKISETASFYEEKMGSEILTASIVRREAGEDFEYELLSEREEAPISYASWNQMRSYAAWEGGILLMNPFENSFGNIDLDLKSNEIYFFHLIDVREFPKKKEISEVNSSSNKLSKSIPILPKSSSTVWYDTLTSDQKENMIEVATVVSLIVLYTAFPEVAAVIRSSDVICLVCTVCVGEFAGKVFSLFNIFFDSSMNQDTSS